MVNSWWRLVITKVVGSMAFYDQPHIIGPGTLVENNGAFIDFVSGEVGTEDFDFFPGKIIRPGRLVDQFGDREAGVVDGL